MEHKLLHIMSGVDVMPLTLALYRNPDLWDAQTSRTQDPTSPHHGLSDIWVRYADVNEGTDKPHDSVWYEAAIKLPQVHGIALDLMRYVGGERLGGVLITKIPPGAMCRPHVDGGTWHADYYDKYAIQIKGNAKQAFHFHGESFSAKPGDVYWFNNHHEHWVTNDSDEDRITMIVCIRPATYKKGD